MDTQPLVVAQIENAIRRYLQAHPQAIDTERGIHEWWLRQSRPPFLAADVHTAVERLAAAGELAVHPLPDGQRAYSITPLTRPPQP